jgi:hydroxyethylthiazole kinase
MMGLAGEIGYKNMLPGEGNSTYRGRIIDAVYNMTGGSAIRGRRNNLSTRDRPSE